MKIGEARRSISWEPNPHEWQEDPVLVQHFSTVRILSLVQLVYAVLGFGTYAVVILIFDANGLTYIHRFQDLVQSCGISYASIIAALLMRYRGGGRRTLLITKIYVILTGLDLLGWAVAFGHLVYEIATFQSADWVDRTFFITDNVYYVSCYLFVGILLSACFVAGLRVVRRASSKLSYFPIGGENDVTSPLVIQASGTDMDYYPLRMLCVIQLAYAILNLTNVIIPYCYPEFYIFPWLTLLLEPEVGVFTVVACLAVFLHHLRPNFFSRFRTSLLTFYSIMIAIDFITGLIRLLVGFAYWVHQYSVYGAWLVDKELAFIPAALWALFPLFYWVLGIIIARRTRMYIYMNRQLSTQIDRTYGI